MFDHIDQNDTLNGWPNVRLPMSTYVLDPSNISDPYPGPLWVKEAVP